ncbi:MAG: amidohydrolase family protein [Spirochaetales bacterium]|nr:amidohydrolase family protein [Spirochaetales bacterium]
MQIIDFHTHAFPDAVAEKAVPALEAAAEVNAFHDGTIAGLLESMDTASIEKAVVCSIATKPSQFSPILEWSTSIRSERLFPLASVHPEDEQLEEHVHEVKKAGLSGIKMHPYYQNYSIDEERMFPFYEALIENELFLVCHTGFDIAYPRDRIADPEKIKFIAEKYPSLCFITTHLGAWEDWKEVEKHLMGKPVYIEISYTLGILEDDEFVRLVNKHPADYLLFGTDSPWDDQKRAKEHLLSLPLSESLKEKMLHTNAARLLKLQ